MRGCQNLAILNFQCLNWSACVASESWGELPVPPAEAIARGTQGVFEFSKLMLREESFYIRGEVFTTEHENIDLSRRNLSEDELLPLLKNFRDGKLSRLAGLQLVISVYVQCDENAAGRDSCGAGWKPNRRQGRGDDRQGAEGQQQPAAAPSCKAFVFVLCFELLLGF